MTTGHLILTGMMGTGKSSVGRELARLTDRRLIDVDEEIQREAGMSVAAIFASEGEDGFRRREREAVRQLPPDGQDIVATGGFTLADPESRETLESMGRVFCLTASPEALSKRLGAPDARSRPLLGQEPGSMTQWLQPGLQDRLESLLAARRPVYDSLPLQVDTTGYSPVETAHRVLALDAAVAGLALNALPVATPSGGYAVVIGVGLLDALPGMLTARGLTRQTIVVTDELVADLFGGRLIAGLRRSGIDARQAVVARGEGAKTLATVEKLYATLADAELGRDGIVIALGGGVVADTAGFCAATYMRGVDYVAVPTTLVGMIDAAIGGKTGVNLPVGKNMVGAFHHPRLVAVDPSLLVSLPPETLSEGLAEVVKAGVIADVGLLERLESRGAPDQEDVARWAELVGLAAAVKVAVVSEDPEEHGRRVVLNLGHTIGHAIETASGHAVSHGHAVAIGLSGAARLADVLGESGSSLEDSFTERLESLLRALDLPVRYEGLSPDEIVDAMALDKKRRGGRLRFVLPSAPGEIRVIEDVPLDAVLTVLNDLQTS